MLYRTMKKSDRKLSILGFGCMRFPLRKDGRVALREATKMLRYAIDHGVNYIDTAYPYHNGESEPIVGKALKGGYREQVNLATKLPSWLVEKREDMDRYLGEQLQRLQTDHIDFYLIHSLTRERWEKLVALGVREFMDRALANGRIHHAGFSFHDNVGAFKEIVDAYDWTFCQIQYNYLDERYQAGTEGLRYAASKGLGVIVMEPLRGGLLVKKVPGVERVWASRGDGRSPAEWGLRWIWDHPEVTVVLSGMSTMAQVKDNLHSADGGRANSLSREELDAIDRVREIYRERMKVSCTGCRYCMPCPKDVSIADCFYLYNSAFMFDSPESAKHDYDLFVGEDGCASKCGECGECEKKCPQCIPIPEKLKEVKALFGK